MLIYNDTNNAGNVNTDSFPIIPYQQFIPVQNETNWMPIILILLAILIFKK